MTGGGTLATLRTIIAAPAAEAAARTSTSPRASRMTFDPHLKTCLWTCSQHVPPKRQRMVNARLRAITDRQFRQAIFGGFAPILLRSGYIWRCDSVYQGSPQYLRILRRANFISTTWSNW
jgi:hypothetical protein